MSTLEVSRVVLSTMSGAESGRTWRERVAIVPNSMPNTGYYGSINGLLSLRKELIMSVKKPADVNCET